jgi:hypothetical protein
MRRNLFLAAMCLCVGARGVMAQCGGTERWPVKVGADPGASQVDLANPVPTALHALVNLPRPSIPSDDTTRTASERTVRVVDGRLVKFKKETGKTGDSDFHLVISDDTLLFSPGGSGTTASPHSLIAEIPDPDCIAGAAGGTATSRFATQLLAVRNKFLQQFPNIISDWNDASGILVRLTGVGFFDRAHGQTGRALNGLELHPLLDIEFNPSTPSPTMIPTTTVALVNPGFESTGGWTASAGVITTSNQQPAHTGTGKAWLGGYGQRHSDRLSQQVTLPAAANVISLSFFLHIDTEEGGQQPFDKMRVLVRNTSGQILQTLTTYSNVQAAPGFITRSLSLTAFKGRTIRIEWEAVEDGAAMTSFVIDDVAIVVEGT